jgi:adenylylsulfate kinase
MTTTPPENRDIYPEFSRVLGRGTKERLLKQRGLVVWLYGLSGSGKTTIAVALEQRLHSEGILTEVLDGDNIRTGLNRDLGFSPEDRTENIRRIAEVAKLFARAGVVTIASFITPTEQLRALAADIIGRDDLVDVYVRCPFETCAARDVKGLYAKAASGGVKHFTGQSAPFEEPSEPALTINSDAESVEDSCDVIYRKIITRIKAQV